VMTSVYQMDCSHQNDELDTRPGRLLQSAVNFMQSQNVQFEISTCKTPNCSFEEPPSQEVKNKVWDYSKLADPTYSDPVADIQDFCGGRGCKRPRAVVRKAGRESIENQQGILRELVIP